MSFIHLYISPLNGTGLWLSYSFSGNIFEESWNTNLKEYMHSYVHCSFIYNRQDLEAIQMFTSRWVDSKKDVVIYTTEYYLVMKRKEILPFVTAWMDLECIMISDISQLEKDKHHMISLICGI